MVVVSDVLSRAFEALDTSDDALPTEDTNREVGMCLQVAQGAQVFQSGKRRGQTSFAPALSEYILVEALYPGFKMEQSPG